MVTALLLYLRIARHESGVHLLLVIVIIRQRGVDLGRCQIRILLDNLRRTVTVGHMIRDNVDHPMACPVDARHPSGGMVMCGQIIGKPLRAASGQLDERSF